MTFDATRTYTPELDVRDWSRWRERLRGEPEGVLWALIGSRRSGKTWALHALSTRDTAYVNLQTDSDGLDVDHARACLLVDEPGRVLKSERLAFVERCAELKRMGVRVLIAMTPGEWQYLSEMDPEEKYVKARDCLCLTPLTDEQATKLTRTVWATQLLAAIPADWRRNPFLLELLLEVAEEYPELRARIDDLVLSTTRMAAQARFRYVHYVFEEGLSEMQRSVVRQIARREGDFSGQPLLKACGLVDVGPRISDPILHDHFREPLIIHHISDVHFGPKSASGVDDKEPGEHGRRFAQAAGARNVRDEYITYVESLVTKKPHAILVSGDLVETGTADQYDLARGFLDQLSRLVGDHADLRTGDPRIAIVGGNHDVDWSQTRGPEGARNRHVAFARHMDGYPRPLLEVAPESRGLSTVTWPGIGVEVALLGSAEFGGEDDETQVQLTALIDALVTRARDAFAVDELALFDELSQRISRLDPGLVHHRDLKRLESHVWTQPVRIAMLHHPVSPIASGTEIARFGELLNAGAVKASLFRVGVSLVLHGHQHSGWFAQESWPAHYGDRVLHIAAAPTLGSRETLVNLGFNEIRIYREGATHFEVEVRRMAFSGSGWDRTNDLMSFVVQ